MGNSLYSALARTGISAPTQVLRGGLRNGDGADRNYIRAPIAGPRGAAAHWYETGCRENAEAHDV
jgi:hypothetical protein